MTKFTYRASLLKLTSEAFTVSEMVEEEVLSRSMAEARRIAWRRARYHFAYAMKDGKPGNECECAIRINWIREGEMDR